MGRLQTFVSSFFGSAEKVKSPHPPGVFLAIPVNAALPPGTLACNGQAINKLKYPELADRLGGKWGTETATQVILPDLNGRTPIGRGTHVSVDTIGKTDGLADAARTPKHVHTTPNHSHPIAGHTHTSPSHTHAGEDHRHSTPSHTHNVPLHDHNNLQNSSALSTGKPGNTGGNVVARDDHQHSAGTYALGNAAAYASNSATGGNTDPIDAAYNHSATVPGNTGANSSSTTSSTAQDDTQGAATLGFRAVRWVVTTGRPLDTLIPLGDR